MPQQRIELAYRCSRRIVDIAREQRHAEVHAIVLGDRDHAIVLVRRAPGWRAKTRAPQRRGIGWVFVEKRKYLVEIFGKVGGLSREHTRGPLIFVMPNEHHT